MNHRINNVSELYEDARTLFNNLVVGGSDISADTIISNLSEAISILQNSWEGKDAGIQIQNLVIVHNAMVDIRNALGYLASTSTKIAAVYRDIQIQNGANLESLGPIGFDTKSKLQDYSDERDSINIRPEANNGKVKVDSAENGMRGFLDEVKRYYSKIMENWVEGPGREEAGGAFDSFISNSQLYQEKLSEVSTKLTTAIQNYGV